LAQEDPLKLTDETDLLYRGSRDQCANFVLLTDALNFCFWSDEPWEVEYRGRTWKRTFAMMAGVLRAIEDDPSWLTADRWARAGLSDIDSVFGGLGSIPRPESRVKVLQETGQILGDRFGGQFSNAPVLVDYQANRLAHLLADEFPSFRDVAYYKGQPVAFLKRAQICAADLHRVWTANGYPGLRDLEHLTVFADYRLPQLFRHEGLLRFSPELAGRIDRGELVAAGTQEEIEIRAATVCLGQLLNEHLRRLGRPADPWQLDYGLWQRAREPGVRVPHHRTITDFY
jgi:hypothetical protein